MTRRRSAATAIEVTRRVGAIFENALDAIFLVDSSGRFVDVNAAAASMLGYPRAELARMRSSALIPAAFAERAAEIRRLFVERRRYEGEFQLRRKDGTLIHAELRAVGDILPGLNLAVARDVTARKQAEESAALARRRLEEAESVAHIGSWEWDLATGAIAWTLELYRLFGVTPRLFRPTYEGFLSLIHPDDRPFVDAACKGAARDGRDFSFDARVVRPDGDVRWIHSRGHAVHEAGGPANRMIGTAQDVTDRVRHEKVRRELVGRMIRAHEDERARLSRELHDGVGQALTALLVGLRRTEDAASLQEARIAARRQRELVAQTIDDLGRLARGLRPLALDDLGLAAALERYAGEKARTFGFEIEVGAGGLGRLPADVETALYRIAQEALANVGAHGRARRVRVAVTRADGEVRLVVTDDGRGFDLRRTRAAGLGLQDIRERAVLLGGRAEVRSRLKRGTTITVALPLPRPAGARSPRIGRS